jgi:hypothetical protein
MLAAVRARHAGLVEQQLKHLILTRALATDNAWDRACQVGGSAVGADGVRFLAVCLLIKRWLRPPGVNLKPGPGGMLCACTF